MRRGGGRGGSGLRLVVAVITVESVMVFITVLMVSVVSGGVGGSTVTLVDSQAS